MALAAAHKGLSLEWVDHDAADRSAIRALSGQELVPVAEIEGEVVIDSMRIVERLEEIAPEPALYPPERAERAELDVFVEWFNEVWKGAPNQIAAELSATAPDLARTAALSARLAGWVERFEALLGTRDHLMGERFSAADVCAFPFLKYAALPREPGDPDPFHRVLVEHQPLGDGHPRLRAWIARVDARPRA